METTRKCNTLETSLPRHQNMAASTMTGQLIIDMYWFVLGKHSSQSVPWQCRVTVRHHSKGLLTSQQPDITVKLYWHYSNSASQKRFIDITETHHHNKSLSTSQQHVIPAKIYQHNINSTLQQMFIEITASRHHSKSLPASQQLNITTKVYHSIWHHRKGLSTSHQLDISAKVCLQMEIYLSETEHETIITY